MLNKPVDLYLLVRCTRRDYAEDLSYNGMLFFNYPMEWIKLAMKGKNGQGDLYEGVFSNNISEKIKRKRADSTVVNIGGREYLRSYAVVESWPCICFYSASDLADGTNDNGTFVYDMAKDYIDSFCEGETFRSMLEKPLNERTSMVVIRDVDEFISRLKRFFSDNGLVEECDYFMHNVRYRTKIGTFVYSKAPLELFNKEGNFKKQQEYRVILNPNSPKVQQMLNGGQKISIGLMEDYAILRSNFYNGAKIWVKDKKVKIEQIDWTNMTGPLHEWELNPLVQIMGAPVDKTTFILDGREVGVTILWMEIEKVLSAKYRMLGFVNWREGALELNAGKDSFEKILKNEEKDPYYYLRNYRGHKAQYFDGVKVWNPEEKKKVYYSDLRYDTEKE